MSPAVRQQESRARSRALTPKQSRQLKQELRQLTATSHHEWLKILKEDEYIEADPDTVIDFLNAFIELANERRISRTGESVDLGAFQQLMQDDGISENDCVRLCTMLLQTKTEEESPKLGKMMLFSLSLSGSEIATLKIMSRAELDSKLRPGLLQSSELIKPRKHLRAMARSGHSSRAMVLEGKLAYQLGEYEHAIGMFTQAVEAAVAASEEEKERTRTKGKTPGIIDVDKDLLSLDAPWLDLASAAVTPEYQDRALWAIEIGCQQDDPTSHYQAARIGKLIDAGTHLATSSWLYHMTKAAGAGHVKAAHELGIFYGSSLWPYINDEPPDRMKPTPFDTYPSASGLYGTVTWYWSRVSIAMGISSPPTHEERENLFHTAAYPSTSRDRLKMAVQWLYVSRGYGYAPSNLVLATLLLKKTLAPDAAAPREALELSDKRYKYASNADFLSGRKTTRDETQVPDTGVENPKYLPEQAKLNIREIFYAALARDLRRDHVKKYRMNTGNRNEDTFFQEKDMSEKTPDYVRKWFRFPDVREMFMNEGKWILWDDAQDVDLEREAKRICEEQEWDIYAHDGSLLYRHGLMRKT